MWGTWSTCSQTCGIGTQTRSALTCNGKKYAGMPCSGNGTETANCQSKFWMCHFRLLNSNHMTVFSVEGAWAGWGSWDTCSATCGTGTRTRTRTFTGGMPCAGSADETESCQGEFWKVSNKSDVIYVSYIISDSDISTHVFSL